MGTLSNMTVKGQVTVPKDMRDALGLVPGEPVEFGWNERGEVVIRKPKRDDEAEFRRIRAQIVAASRQFAHLREGRPTDEIMKDIRGDDPFPP
jgi:AbrB family looped-hinge helix DNA binding protein